VPTPTVRIVFDETDGLDVRALFLHYGGTQKKWDWIVRRLRAMDARLLRRRCATLGMRAPCHRLVYRPCVVYGVLAIDELKLWEEGVLPGLLTIDAIVHRNFETKYLQDSKRALPPGSDTL
jgi:hypothetical protein